MRRLGFLTYPSYKGTYVKEWVQEHSAKEQAYYDLLEQINQYVSSLEGEDKYRYSTIGQTPEFDNPQIIYIAMYRIKDGTVYCIRNSFSFWELNSIIFTTIQPWLAKMFEKLSNL